MCFRKEDCTFEYYFGQILAVVCLPDSWLLIGSRKVLGTAVSTQAFVCWLSSVFEQVRSVNSSWMLRASHAVYLISFRKNSTASYGGRQIYHHHHHHKHQELDRLIRSVSKVTTALSNVSSIFQLFSFLVVCSSTISKGFGFVAFFASVETSSVCIRLSCLVCL